jgi:hypothetical protein
MILAAPSNASYLSETMGHSHTGGHFILSDNDKVPQNNCAILATAQIIKAVCFHQQKWNLVHYIHRADPPDHSVID